MNTSAEAQTMELLDQAAPEMIASLLSLKSCLIKEAILGLIPAAQFRLRKWNLVKQLTEEQLTVMVFNYYRDLIADEELTMMTNQ